MEIVDILKELKTILENDSDINKFCRITRKGNNVTVLMEHFNLNKIPIRSFPVIVISDEQESDDRRFLFSEKEINVIIMCGIIENDNKKAMTDLISFKELIKQAIKKDQSLNGKVTFSMMIKSNTIPDVPKPLNFKKMTIYINYRDYKGETNHATDE